MTMPEDLPSTPSERPILAFFDVDNTLMRGTSLFQLGREAWNKKVITSPRSHGISAVSSARARTRTT